jgi:hypothetical protein
MGLATFTSFPSRVNADPADAPAPAANTPTVITYAAAGAGLGHVISGVAFGYDLAPTGGKLTIEDGSGNVVFQAPVTNAGPGVFYFTPAKQGSGNAAMILTLAAGGTGVKGYLSVLGHWTAGNLWA